MMMTTGIQPTNDYRQLLRCVNNEKAFINSPIHILENNP